MFIKTSYNNENMTKEKSPIPWKIGFTTSAENWNGRLAMIGFFLVLVIELISNQNITQLLHIV